MVVALRSSSSPVYRTFTGHFSESSPAPGRARRDLGAERESPLSCGARLTPCPRVARLLFVERHRQSAKTRVQKRPKAMQYMPSGVSVLVWKKRSRNLTAMYVVTAAHRAPTSA